MFLKAAASFRTFKMGYTATNCRGQAGTTRIRQIESHADRTVVLKQKLGQKLRHLFEQCLKFCKMADLSGDDLGPQFSAVLRAQIENAGMVAQAQLARNDHGSWIGLFPSPGRIGFEHRAQPIGKRPCRFVAHLPHRLNLRHRQRDIEKVIRVLAQLQLLEENRCVVAPTYGWHAALGITVRRRLALT
jgi:hypothetical protein